MNDRLIFPNLSLFKKQITEKFAVVTREIYKNHPVYLYNDDDLVSKILIYPSYANVEAPGKQPMMTIKAGGYDFSLTDTFNQNMTSESIDSNGVVVGQKYWKLMNTSLMIIIRAYAEEEATDIADEFASLLVFACKKMYGSVGIIIRAVRVGETDIVDKDQGIYQTTINVPIEAMWSAVFESTDPPIDDIGVEVDLPLDYKPGDYSAPGIEVWKQSLK